MAIESTEMTMAPSRERGGSRCAAGSCANFTSGKAARRRRRDCHLHLHLVSRGALFSALLLLLRGDTVAAPPPLSAFAAGGPSSTRPAVLGRCGVFSIPGGQGVRGISRAAAAAAPRTAARCGVCLMAAAGGDKEEKMELAAEVCGCKGPNRGKRPAGI